MPSVVDKGIHQGVKYETTEIDHGMDFIEKELKKLKSKDAYTAIGYFAGKSFDPSKDIVARAMVHEYGTRDGRIPKRPFKRMTFEKNIKNIEKRKAAEYDRILAGKQTAKQALSRLGEWYVGKMKMMIKTGSFIPLKPLTIRRKRGGDKPLIDTGQMRNSVTHREFGV
jgi:hypothetical protein